MPPAPSPKHSSSALLTCPPPPPPLPRAHTHPPPLLLDYRTVSQPALLLPHVLSCCVLVSPLSTYFLTGNGCNNNPAALLPAPHHTSQPWRATQPLYQLDLDQQQVDPDSSRTPALATSKAAEAAAAAAAANAAGVHLKDDASAHGGTMMRAALGLDDDPIAKEVQLTAGAAGLHHRAQPHTGVEGV